MKLNSTSTTIVFLVLLALVYFSFQILLPSKTTGSSTPLTEFSSERALVHLKKISEEPHFIGSDGHDRVREYLVNELEILGLETEIQEDFVYNKKWSVLAKPKNILARIKGSENGKALLLLAHYDSAPHSGSYGASDAGSGVVTILESVRAYLSAGTVPRNDIIILFSDAEEIGLLGAKLFVQKHPWAQEVGLVINFEARGSGGPANMIVETSGGNAHLIREFIKAEPSHPVATSLMYSVYKMLPNDTDSTIFREEGDIDSFFFAFIDDHYDYHTANDTYENLDRNTLEHQGTYAMAMLRYFSQNDLGIIKAETDNVYFNFPGVKMITYPFSWIFPLLILSIGMFIAVVFYGISTQKLDKKEIARGFIPLLSSLLAAGLITYFGWLLILKIYPHYKEMLHGFTYNGKWYIAACIAYTLTVLFSFYGKFHRKEKPVNLAVAPLFIWLLLNIALAVYLKGGSYFIIPVIFGIISLFLMIKLENNKLLPVMILAMPAIFILAPLILFFPVGLGLGMMVISAVFTVLLFGLLVPLVASFRFKTSFAVLFFLLGTVCIIAAHFQSKFSEKRQKPNSLVYFHDMDDSQSYWTTYDKKLDPWTRNYLGKKTKKASDLIENIPGSKYKTGFTFASSAPLKEIPHPEISLNDRYTDQGYDHVNFTVFPKKNSNRITLFADTTVVFNSFVINGEVAPKENNSEDVFKNRESPIILNYYLSDADSLEVNFSVPEGSLPVITLQETSFDLLENPLFTIEKRTKKMMPKPFVTTDAIIIQRKLNMKEFPLSRKISQNPDDETAN